MIPQRSLSTGVSGSLSRSGSSQTFIVGCLTNDVGIMYWRSVEKPRGIDLGGEGYEQCFTRFAGLRCILGAMLEGIEENRITLVSGIDRGTLLSTDEAKASDFFA